MQALQTNLLYLLFYVIGICVKLVSLMIFVLVVLTVGPTPIHVHVCKNNVFICF